MLMQKNNSVPGESQGRPPVAQASAKETSNEGVFVRNSFVFPRIRCYASHLTKKFKEAMAVMNFWGY